MHAKELIILIIMHKVASRDVQGPSPIVHNHVQYVPPNCPYIHTHKVVEALE
jgi:hypothetical protein